MVTDRTVEAVPEFAPSQNFTLESREGFYLVGLKDYEFDPLKETVVMVVGIHPNEIEPLIYSHDGRMRDGKPCEMLELNENHPHLRAVRELNAEGALPYNLVIVADPLRDFDFHGNRSILTPRLPEMHADGNRMANAGVVEKAKKMLVDPTDPLPPAQLDLSAEIDEEYQRQLKITLDLEKRIIDLSLFIRRSYPLAAVAIAHSDKEHFLPLSVIDRGSHTYTYFHSELLSVETLKALNRRYLEHLKRSPDLPDNLRIAPKGYIDMQGPHFVYRPGFNETDTGGVFLTAPDPDGSLEVLLMLLGQPIALSFEMQDNLNFDEQAKLIKLFYKCLLEPLADFFVGVRDHFDI